MRIREYYTHFLKYFLIEKSKIFFLHTLYQQSLIVHSEIKVANVYFDSLYIFLKCRSYFIKTLIKIATINTLLQTFLGIPQEQFHDISSRANHSWFQVFLLWYLHIVKSMNLCLKL